jgi:hypothetical protein
LFLLLIAVRRKPAKKVSEMLPPAPLRAVRSKTSHPNGAPSKKWLLGCKILMISNRKLVLRIVLHLLTQDQPVPRHSARPHPVLRFLKVSCPALRHQVLRVQALQFPALQFPVVRFPVEQVRRAAHQALRSVHL